MKTTQMDLYCVTVSQSGDDDTDSNVFGYLIAATSGDDVLRTVLKSAAAAKFRAITIELEDTVTVLQGATK